jgi:hypothetical protein
VTPNSLFSVFIRLIGVWKLLEAIDISVTLFNVSSGASKTDLLSSTSYLNHAVASGAVGLVLLLAAPAIASMFYAPTEASKSAQ